MSNQSQFIRQAAAVLMACGLNATLLPSLAAAQSRSTPPTGNFAIPTFQKEPGAVERRSWVIEQFRAEWPLGDVPGARLRGANGKFGPAGALARLAAGVNDAQAIRAERGQGLSAERGSGFRAADERRVKQVSHVPDTIHCPQIVSIKMH